MRRLVLAILLSSACAADSSTDAVPLGRQQLSGYRIDAATSISLSKAGFGVTNTSAGHFRLLWVGDASDVLSGILTTDGVFDPTGTSPLGGKELVANQADRIEFRLSPTASVNGLDLITSSGPIYLDLQRNEDRNAATLSFMRSGQVATAAFNPVAIDVRSP